MTIAIHEPRQHGMDIGARTDDEQDDQEERLEVEESRLYQPLSVTILKQPRGAF